MALYNDEILLFLSLTRTPGKEIKDFAVDSNAFLL